MTKSVDSWTEVLNTTDRVSTFGIDPDGKISQVEVPGLSAFAVAMEKLLPGDELVTREGNNIIVAQLKHVEPLGMAQESMTWTKNLVITRKRRVKGTQSYWREVERFFSVGILFTATKMVDGFLVELTYQDGHKAFLVGILNFD